MQKILLLLTFFFGTLLHIYFLQINEILKVADSFAYLQMSEYLKQFSTQWFWTGWFGFLYSLPIAGIDYFLNNQFLSAQILNIVLFNFSGLLLYKIAKKYLSPKYLILLLALFFLSPILLHFNIAILSENIYIPLFLMSVLWLQNFIAEPKVSDAIVFAFLIALMYLTRWEAFIYLWAIGLVSFFLLFMTNDRFVDSGWYFEQKAQENRNLKKLLKKINFWKFVSFNILLILFFVLFVSPYIYHLHSLTWEWGLSNKGSSNLRQATLRWKEKMDDEGFEKAVAEMTPDSKHLIAGFAWGLKYDKPTTSMSLQNYILSDSTRFLNNWKENQKKLYSKNIPNIILWDAGKLYFNSDSHLFYKNKLFFLALLIPLILLIIGFINLYINKKRDILIIFFSFFCIASIFFTLFFTLNRYFIIFIPLFLLVIVYGVQTLDSIITFTWTGFSKKSLDKNNFSWKNILKLFVATVFVWIYSLWLLSYYNSHKSGDERYLIKKEVGEWLKVQPLTASLLSREKDNFNILERFPIVTYYSGTQHRWITPYTNSLKKLLIYARYNKIDYLIVDTLDFKKYRPDLNFLLDEEKTFKWLERVKVFRKSFESKLQKVIIYKIVK